MTWRIQAGDARTVLAGWPAGSVQTVVTSPPYYLLRDYGIAGQIGLESSLDAYIAALVEVFRAVRRVMRPDATLWLNIGDSYSNAGRAGSRGAKRGAGKPGWTDGGALGDKQLLLIPARVALALQADGWLLRSEIIWHKLNPMPESVTDRPTKAHEQVFLFAKQGRYYYNADAIREPHISPDTGDQHFRNSARYINQGVGVSNHDHAGDIGEARGYNPLGRNKRDVWSLASEPVPMAHFATMPTALVEPCILAGSRPGDVVADPFTGAGTVGVVALRHGRGFWGAELNESYCRMATERIEGDCPMFNRQEEGAA